MIRLEPAGPVNPRKESPPDPPTGTANTPPLARIPGGGCCLRVGENGAETGDDGRRIGYWDEESNLQRIRRRRREKPFRAEGLKLGGIGALFDFLYGESDRATRLLVNCVLARRAEAEAIAREHPEIVRELPDVDRELVAKYCWETNTNYDAVKLMLDVGFPVAHPERNHGYTPLHNAAWAGLGDPADLLLARGHPGDIREPRCNATPLGLGLHDCLMESRHPEGDSGGGGPSSRCIWGPPILPMW